MKHSPKTSTALRQLLDSLESDDPISMSEIIARLDGRAFGILIFILAVPNCVPNIPGLSTLFGLLLLAPALPMIFGARKIWLPANLKNTKIEPKHLRLGILNALPTLEKIERFIKPRLEFLTQGWAISFLGLEILLLAVILIFPIPFGNMVPGFAVALIALGILQRDGVLIIIANILILLSIRLAYIGIDAGIKALNLAYDAFQNYFNHLFSIVN